MANNNKYQILVRAKLDDADLTSQLDDLQKNVDKSMKEMPKASATTSKNVSDLAKGFGATSKSADDITANLVKWNDSLRNMEATNPTIFDMDEIKELRTEVSGLMESYAETPLDQVGGKTKELNQRVAHLRSTTSSLTKEVGNQNKEMIQAAKAGDKWGTVIKKNTLKVFQWMVATGAIYGSLKQIKDGIQYITDLNKALVDVQVVTGGTSKEMDKLAKSYNELAIAMGATTLEIADASLTFIRQGKSAEESAVLVRNSLMMSKLANMESSAAAEYLTSIMNGYKMSVEETTIAVDKMVAVDNLSATSIAELAEAMQKSSNIAQMAGVSFDDLVSYIGTVSSVTRKAASSIGESFNFYCAYA